MGNRTQTQRANGITSTYGYDDLHRLTGIEHKKGTEVLSQFAYTLNNDGKRGTLTEFVKYPEGQTVASINRTVYYGYDNAGRLIGEQRQSRQTLAAGGTVDKTAHTVWGCDKANNRTTQNLSNYDGIGTDTPPSVLTSTHATEYNYNSNDWLLSQTSEYTTSNATNTYTTNYEYNGNGSQSAVITNIGTPDQKRTPYFYDFEEKLIGIGNPADTTKHAYAYDADGNRVTETNYNSGTPTTKHYLVDPNVSNAQVVEEFDSANQLLAHHDWDDAELLRSAVADSEGNAHITHPLADGHNSTRQLMDATGSIGGVLGYDAWGNAQESIGLSTVYRYNGQRLDVSGLYHLRARQYAPWTGRFLSHDPLLGDVENPISQHRYLYANADGVNFVDPSGEESLGNTLTSMGINTTLTARVASTSMNILGAVGMAGGAYNIYSDYMASGEVNPWDVTFLMADILLPRLGSRVLSAATQGIRTTAKGVLSGTANYLAKLRSFQKFGDDVREGLLLESRVARWFRSQGRNVHFNAHEDDLADIMLDGESLTGAGGKIVEIYSPTGGNLRQITSKIAGEKFRQAKQDHVVLNLSRSQVVENLEEVQAVLTRKLGPRAKRVIVISREMLDQVE